MFYGKKDMWNNKIYIDKKSLRRNLEYQLFFFMNVNLSYLASYFWHFTYESSLCFLLGMSTLVKLIWIAITIVYRKIGG